ncbi:MAG: sigma-70 family RNA polymerase sigma factor [Phycisphaerales bacterium]|nr:sigma-70 family RNA polymerase sigma factor [Phycisphaerales bacterium]
MSRVLSIIDAPTLQSLLLEREQLLRSLIRKRLTPALQEVLSEDDVLQEIWLVVFRNISSYLPDGQNSFDRWLMSVAIKSIINMVKSANRLKRGGGRMPVREKWNPGSSYVAFFNDLAAEGRTPSREVFAAEAADAVKGALSELPQDRQCVIFMRYLEGKSLDEIAIRTGKSKPAIRSLVYHGMRQMKRQLGHSSHFFSDAATDV